MEEFFRDVLTKFSREKAAQLLAGVTPSQVMRALSKKGPHDLSDFATLISPAAKQFLPQLVAQSRAVSERRFGRTIQMYIPMYLSNECQNVCTYCGFSFGNSLPRITLNSDQILQEVAAIKKLGYDHVLLVSGEARKTVGVDYFKEALTLIRPHFAQVSIEVQPLEEHEYRELRELGLYAVLVYQETYSRSRYKEVHPKGKKSNFDYRLETAERLGRAGIHKVGLGVLLGLDDWRIDSLSTALHLSWLSRRYWKTKYSISFPRLRPAEGVALAEFQTMDEDDLIQLICAYRLFDESVELSLSTRESPSFRERAIGAGITSISAGSCTEPGGYALKSNALKQFEIDDDRSPAEMAAVIQRLGYEPVWKDWESSWSAHA